MTELEKVLESFKQSIPGEIDCSILVVGSMALHAHGFTSIIPQDIDLEIKSRHVGLNFYLLGLEENSRIQKEKENYPKDLNHLRYDFTFQGVKFNVWAVKEFGCLEEEMMWKNFTRYAPISSIISWKKKYGRPKDFQMIDKLACELLKGI